MKIQDTQDTNALIVYIFSWFHFFVGFGADKINFQAVKPCFLLNDVVVAKKEDKRPAPQSVETNVIKILLKKKTINIIIVLINEIDFHAVKIRFLLGDGLTTEEKEDRRPDVQSGETNVIKKLLKKKIINIIIVIINEIDFHAVKFRFLPGHGLTTEEKEDRRPDVQSGETNVIKKLVKKKLINIVVIINEIDFHAVKFRFLPGHGLTTEEKEDRRPDVQSGETNVIKKL